MYQTYYTRIYDRIPRLSLKAHNVNLYARSYNEEAE